MLGKIEGKRRRGVTEDETVGITDSMDEFEQAPGDGDQGSLACYSLEVAELDTTWRLNSNNNPQYTYFEEIITQLSTIYELLT